MVGVLATLEACATYDEPSASKSREAAAEQDALAEPGEEQADKVAPAAAPAAADLDAEGGVASLDEIQRRLAANNAKLRALGVDLEGREDPAGATSITTDRTGDGAGGKSGAGISSPTPKPAPGGAASNETKQTSKDAKPKKSSPRRDAPAKPTESKPSAPKSEDAAADEITGGSRAEPAKSTPLGPAGDNRDQGAVGRCQQICDLSEISCGLGDQICELAERHPDDTDYAEACERANDDCDAAKEACDACTE
jgi:hypothetical protein